MVAAGTLPLAGVSALQAIAETLRMEKGTRLLVHGAAGGVGLLAVGLAKHLGAKVVATAHGTGVGVLAELGVEVVDTERTDVTALAPFDATLDLVGQDPELPVRVTLPGGRATRGGPDPPSCRLLPPRGGQGRARAESGRWRPREARHHRPLRRALHSPHVVR